MFEKPIRISNSVTPLAYRSIMRSGVALGQQPIDRRTRSGRWDILHPTVGHPARPLTTRLLRKRRQGEAIQSSSWDPKPKRLTGCWAGQRPNWVPQKPAKAGRCFRCFGQPISHGPLTRIGKLVCRRTRKVSPAKSSSGAGATQVLNPQATARTVSRGWRGKAAHHSICALVPLDRKVKACGTAIISLAKQEGLPIL